jgi:hypothetical protein
VRVRISTLTSNKTIITKKKGPVCCEVPSLHFILLCIPANGLDDCFFNTFDVILSGLQCGSSCVDVAPVRVSSDGITQALVEKAVFCGLCLQTRIYKLQNTMVGGKGVFGQSNFFGIKNKVDEHGKRKRGKIKETGSQ